MTKKRKTIFVREQHIWRKNPDVGCLIVDETGESYLDGDYRYDYRVGDVIHGDVVEMDGRHYIVNVK